MLTYGVQVNVALLDKARHKSSVFCVLNTVTGFYSVLGCRMLSTMASVYCFQTQTSKQLFSVESAFIGPGFLAPMHPVLRSFSLHNFDLFSCNCIINFLNNNRVDLIKVIASLL